MVSRRKSAAFPANAAGNFPGYLSNEPKDNVTVDTPDGTVSAEGLGAYEFGAPIRPDELWSPAGYPPWKGTRRKVWNGDGSR
jgi:hypothetical protein